MITIAKIGYASVRTEGQNDDSQVDGLTAYGVGKLFIDDGVSGKHAVDVDHQRLPEVSANTASSSVRVVRVLVVGQMAYPRSISLSAAWSRE